MAFYKVSLDTWKAYNAKRDKRLPELNEDNYMKIVKPKRSTLYSAGYDIFLPFDVDLKAGESIVIPTGIKVELPSPDCFLALYPRSSLGFKYGMRLLTTVSVGDYDYYNNPDNEGHYLIGFSVEKDMKLPLHSKFCQGVIQKYYLMEDDETSGSRTGGIGSTGN